LTLSRVSTALAGTRKRRSLVFVATAVAIVGAFAGVASAVFPDDGVITYAGCLNLSSGLITSVAVGNTPLHSCASGQSLVHLSGGDITSVNAGTGITGGGTSGATSVSVSPSFRLPQGCSNGFVPKWTAASSTWSCASDSNSGGTLTGVIAGTGLSGGGTSGSPSLSLQGGYQLPQGCADGQTAKSDGIGGWICGNDDTGSAPLGPHIYYTHLDQHFAPSTGPNVQFSFDGFGFVEDLFDLPAGTYLVQAHVDADLSGGSPPVFLDCRLLGPDGGTLDEYSTNLESAPLGDESSLRLDATTTLATPANLHVACGYFTDDLTPLSGDNLLIDEDRSMTAIPLSAVN
jgi:hypothetical protein